MHIARYIKLRLALFRPALRCIGYNFRLYYPKVNVPNLIISSGGASSTLMIKYLSRFIECNDQDDKDGLKHVPYPAKTLAKSRILYLYDSPEIVCESLCRRGLDLVQALKLKASISILWDRGSIREELLFAIHEQIKLFKGCDFGTLLCIEYNDIWECKRDIAKHFGIVDPAFVENFPPRKPRKNGKGLLGESLEV